MTPSLVVLGNLIVDDVVFADGSTRMAQAGGAVLYAALGARLWEVSTGCASVVGNDYPAQILEQLQRRGADLAGLCPLNGPGARAWLLYEEQARQVVHRLGRPSHASVSPRPHQIPPDWRAAPAFHLAPMPFDVQREWLAVLNVGPPPFVSVDPHVPVTEDTFGDWRDILAGADAFFPSEDELLLAEVQQDPRAVLPRLAHGRLRFVVFKRGERGGILYDAHEGRFHSWTARVSRMIGPTGAGDAFAAGFIAGVLDGISVESCLRRAIVSASFALETWGSEGVLSAGRADAEGRLREWYPDEVTA